MGVHPFAGRGLHVQSRASEHLIPCVSLQLGLDRKYKRPAFLDNMHGLLHLLEKSGFEPRGFMPASILRSTVFSKTICYLHVASENLQVIDQARGMVEKMLANPIIPMV